MARQPKAKAVAAAAATNDEEKLQVLSHTPVEKMPEEAGTMTGAAANAAPRPPEEKQPAKALQQAEPEAVELAPKPTWYRVLHDKKITGSTGFRATVRAGKELSSHMYNIKKLRAQGVKLEEIPLEEVSSL